MNIDKVIEILKTEKECVSRNNGNNCNRDCKNCDLLLPAEDILKAYILAIGVIEGIKNCLDKQGENYWN